MLKMNSAFAKALVILTLLQWGLGQNVSKSNDEVKEILEFLHKGEEQLKSTTHKEIIYVLGPTGTGKSTLVHFLAANPSFLRSIASDEDSLDDFIIEHLHENKIGNVTFQSRTIYPDLVIDEHNVPYYDCPGFSDTRATNIEIATTYFTKKAINNADRLKMVFVVNFNSMMRGTSSRKDFAEFVQHATEFVKNVKLYKPAIILVASKVPAHAGQVGGDDKLVNKVRSFLKEYRQFLLEEEADQTDSKEKDVILSKLNLVDTFLTNGRIVLFKRPNAPGLLSQLPDMMENREKLRDSINKNINFADKNDDDFGYTLSDRSKLKINALAEEINQKITNLFEHINRRVIDEYSNKKVNFNDIASLQNEMDDIIKTLSRISNSSAESTMLASVNRLNILNLHGTLIDIENHMGYIKFLETVHDGSPITRRTSDWIGALRSCMEYLVKEKNWYSFADTLLHRLSEYDVQSNVSKYDVADVDRWSLGGDATADSGILITGANFKNFLTKIMAFELVEEDTEASPSKIDLLNSILSATVKSRSNKICDGDKVTVKGHFVKFSDLENYETFCDGHPVELLEVFALSTIFFDADFRGNVDLVVIAPKWNIIHEHVRITLDGANGTDGVNQFDRSFDGKPGQKGKNANHFFGYADRLVNAENLYITAVGGSGGHGGDGYNGADGKTVTVPADGSNGEHLSAYARVVRRDHESDMGFLWFNQRKWDHETFETFAHCPSVNGIAGSGGFGGYGGIIETNGMSELKTLTKDGEDGTHGSPGKCGKIYEKVQFYKTRSTACWFWFICGSKTSWNAKRFNDATCQKNCRNSTLVNLNGISKPEPAKRSNFAFSIDHYKSFVREHLQLPMISRFVTDFLRSMEQNSKIRAAYDTASFIDDFYQIESQFHLLNNNDDHSSMVYFYQSLLDRILEYVAHPSNKLQANERKTLATLYTAGLSKICKIRSGTEQSLIIDIEMYLDVAIEHIALLEKSGKKAAINRFKNQYRRNLQASIDENYNLITTDVMPAIEQLGVEIDTVIENLLAKVTEEKNSIASHTDRYDRLRKKLGEVIVPRGMLNFVKIVADVASSFTGFGMIVSRAVNTINRVADAFADGKECKHHVNMPCEQIYFGKADDFEVDDHQPESSERVSQSKSLLSVIDEILEMAIGFSFYDILEPMKVVRRKLMGEKRVDLKSTEIDLLHADVQDIIEKKVATVKTHSRNETKSLKALDKLCKKLSVLHMDVDMFNKFASNDHQLYEIDSAMRESNTKLMELKNLERHLELSVAPLVEHMRSFLGQIPRDSEEGTMPSLDLFKWNAKNIFSNMRYHMQQFRSLNWKLNGELIHIVDKLDGTISTLGNMFERIQIHGDQVRLSNYIATIESADYSLEMDSSSEQADKLNHLNAVIESNVILTIYANAVNGFKQTVFPFADFYLRRFTLPPQLETETNLKVLVTKATEELVNLKLTLKEYHSASINMNDNLIHTADFSSDFTSTKPFYVWTGDKHGGLISKLLSGENITVKADITKGPKLNAVKFQYLHIHLKSADQANQAKLDKFLENFDVTIVHHGNSYYRCDNQFYLITSPTERISYSFEEDSNGRSIRGNNVYHKMRNGDFVLSPYALLTISLKARYPEQFMLFNVDFGQGIDLELTGRGQYLNPNVDACDGLQKYYEADEV